MHGTVRCPNVAALDCGVSVRTRLIAMLLAVLSVALIAQYVRHWTAVPAAVARTSDFAGSYVAATLWRDGHGSAVYDDSAEQAALAAEGVAIGHDRIPFENPPSALWPAALVTALSPEDAFRAWSLLQLLLALGALLIVVRAAPWPASADRVVKLAAVAVGIGALPVALLFTEAQWDGFSMLGLALAYSAWRRGKHATGGFALGLLGSVAKPHLLIGVVAFLVGRRDWRALAGLAAGGAVCGLAALAAVGPAGLATYARVVVTPANSPSTQMLSLTGLAASWLGSGALISLLTYAGDAALLAAAVLTGSRSRGDAARLEVGLFTAVALGLVATPHQLVHDLTLLAPVALALFARAGSLDGRPWPGAWSAALLAAWVALDVAARLDLGNAATAPPGRLVPIALLLTALLGWVMLRRVATHGLTTPMTAAS
jgi:hypothetical protein